MLGYSDIIPFGITVRQYIEHAGADVSWAVKVALNKWPPPPPYYALEQLRQFVESDTRSQAIFAALATDLALFDSADHAHMMLRALLEELKLRPLAELREELYWLYEFLAMLHPCCRPVFERQRHGAA